MKRLVELMTNSETPQHYSLLLALPVVLGVGGVKDFLFQGAKKISLQLL